MEKYINYINTFENPSNEKVISWVNSTLKNYLKSNPDIQDEVEHILDYLLSQEAPKTIKGMSFEEAKKNTEKWNKTLIKNGKNFKETDKDIELVLDFNDGFKIVKLVGENAYKREGYLMSNCVASYFGKNSEIYSLRDKNNLPHCTIEKDQQIKGRGNGDIHPKYVDYVVRFLEFIGMTVGDNEMKHLGYINVDDILEEEPDLVFPELYNKKYFKKDLLSKVENKDSISLWGKFSLFNFGKDMEVLFNFDFDKVRENFNDKLNKKTLFKKLKINKPNDNKVAMTSYNKVAMTYDNEVAMTSYNKVAMTSYNEVAMTSYNKVAMTNNNEVAMTSYNKVAMTSYNEVAMTNDNEVAMTSYNKVAMTYNNKVAMTNDNKVAMTYNNKVFCKEKNIISGIKNNQVNCGSKNVVVLGNNSKVKGKVGTLVVLYETDNDFNIKNHKAVMIDGKKVKEDVWYTLKDGKLVETN